MRGEREVVVARREADAEEPIDDVAVLAGVEEGDVVEQVEGAKHLLQEARVVQAGHLVLALEVAALKQPREHGEDGEKDEAADKTGEKLTFGIDHR